MFTAEVIVSKFVQSLSDLELKQLPFATMLALNDSMFDVRNDWADEIQQVFDRPVPFTQKAVLYRKATKQNLVADVFLRGRDEMGSGGTPPSRYLLPHVTGGARDEKPFEFLLREAGLLGDDEYVIPARGFPLDAFGNVPQRVVTTVISDLQAARDPQKRSTPETRARRARRKDVSKRAVYFEASPKLSASQGKRQPLPRGIYERTAFKSGSSIRMVFVIVRGPPTYAKRFDAYALARRSFELHFPVRFRTRLKQALATARIR